MINTNTNKFKKIFLLSVIFIGLIIFILLLLSLLKSEEVKNEKKNTTSKIETLNNGIGSTYLNPVDINTVTLASFNNEDEIAIVDVKVIKYLQDDELENYDLEVHDGFIKKGIIYNVSFNEVGETFGNLAPILKTQIYFMNGSYKYKYNNYLYEMNTKSYYNGNGIADGQNDSVVLVYEVPSDVSYSVCFGNIDYKLGCFKGGNN